MAGERAAVIRAVLLCRVSSLGQDAPDKVSLDEQEKAGRALCDRAGYTVIEVIRFAHSTDYIRWDKWTEALRSKGINAADRLDKLWETHGFDVLVLFSDSRLGRTEALLAVIVLETVKSGAFIHLVDGGIVNQENVHSFIALSGFKASSETSHMRRLRIAAMEKRAASGAPIGKYPTLAFTVAKGKHKAEDRLIVRDDRRLIWPVVARVYCSKVSAADLDEAVYRSLIDQYGETNPYDGTPWPHWNQPTLFNLLMNPVAWGHRVIGRYFTAPNGRRRKRDGSSAPRWAYDQSINPPAPIKIYRNVHEALWTGETAEKLIAALNYRKDIVSGRAAPIVAFKFTGLMVCGNCGKRISGQKDHWQHTDGSYTVYWRCYSKDGQGHTDPLCKSTIHDMVIQTQFNDVLERILKAADLDSYFAEQETVDPNQAALARLETEVVRLDTRLRRLIDLQVDAPNEAARGAYQAKIAQTSGALEASRSQLDELRHTLPFVESPVTKTRRIAAVERIRAMGASNFWQLAPDLINEVLHGVLGDHVMVVDIQLKRFVGPVKRKRGSGSDY